MSDDEPMGDDRTDADRVEKTDADEEIQQLFAGVLDGEHRALARTISKIEDRAPGYRRLVSGLYAHAGEATVIGVTGSPGAGKSTLVDKLAERCRERGDTVGVIAIDPSSPYTGGAVLGDRIRMASTVGDMDVFVRSMSARGTLGGLSTATTDAITAMDAFGKDTIIVETVGAGQNEIDVVRTAETVCVLVPPGSGDAVQTLKAGILEIADVLVVNKADRPGTDRTVRELTEMVDLGAAGSTGGHGHHGPSGTTRGSSDHGPDDADRDPDGADSDPNNRDETWRVPIVETVATDGGGVDELLSTVAEHRTYLEVSGESRRRHRARTAEAVRRILRQDLSSLLATEIDRAGGFDEIAAAIERDETDPYTVASALLEPVEVCLEEFAGERDERAR